MVRLTTSLVLTRFFALAGKTRAARESPMGAPPVQLPATDHKLFVIPVHVCVAGARRLSHSSSRGRYHGPRRPRGGRWDRKDRRKPLANRRRRTRSMLNLPRFKGLNAIWPEYVGPISPHGANHRRGRWPVVRTCL